MYYVYVRCRDGGAPAAALSAAAATGSGGATGPTGSSAGGSTGAHFLEMYLEASPSGFTLPTAPAKRFEGRCLSEGVEVRAIAGTGHHAETSALGGPSGAYDPAAYAPSVPLRVVPVSSQAPPGAIKRTRDDLVANGAWAVYLDLVPKGGPLGPSVATYYGLPVDSRLHLVLQNAMRPIYASVASLWPHVSYAAEPFVTYHGTARSAVKTILQEGLKPSFGMLGTAVYLGSFWKSFRFATLTQDYKRRPGAILRIYAFWRFPYLKTLGISDRCKCSRCGAPVPDAVAKLCDHNAVWSAFAKAVIVWPVVGGPIKNEEYATIDPGTLLIESVGHAEATTERHEPFNRTLHIL